MTKLLRSFNAYAEPRILSIFFLGFSSGLPFLLILATLSVWLSESGISKTQIGLLAWVTIPYSLKFIWAPIIDHVQIPFMSRFFGKRRGWMLASQVMLILSIIMLGLTNPDKNLLLTSIFALLVGVFSATQDIVVEAFRIEVLPKNRIGYGASASVLGYRLGMLVSGAGALYIAAFFNSWAVAYIMMSACVVVGILAALLSEEPKHKKRKKASGSSVILFGKYKKFSQHLDGILVQPFAHFVKRGDWFLILPFILFYKVGDTVLNTMSMPFLIEIGFSKVEIAHVAKTFGISAMILGGILGGITLSKYSLRRNLIFCTSLQIFASLLFMGQAQFGHHLPFLFMTMGLENLTCGMSQVALIAYFSYLCKQPHTATHYALLSSFASFSRVILSTLAGYFADQVTWSYFYQFISFACLPGLLMVILFSSHFKAVDQKEMLKAA